MKSCSCAIDKSSVRRALVAVVNAPSGTRYEKRRCWHCGREFYECFQMRPIISCPSAMTAYMLHESRT